MKYFIKFYNPAHDDETLYESNVEPIPVPDGRCQQDQDDFALTFIDDESALRNLVPLCLYRDQDMNDLVKDYGDQIEKKFEALRKRCYYLIERLAESDEQNSAPINNENVSFERWLDAANYCRKKPLSENFARTAWREGMDPTEFAGK